MAEGGIETERLGSRVLGHVRESIQSIVNESRLPTKAALGYESTVGIYGGKLIKDGGGRLIYDTSGRVSKIDHAGDAVLRTFDEHIARRPVELLLRHPGWFFGHLFPNPLRYRGRREEIAANAQRLGLGRVYTLHPKGIEIRRPDIYRRGIALQDIYRADQIRFDILNGINRFEALAQAAKYARSVHDNYGAIGELLPSDVIFQNIDDGRVTNPILNLPDEIYNPSKAISERAKKATDILDFLVSIGFEEARRTNDWTQVKQALKTIVENYADKEVIRVVESFAKRGRLVMLGDEESINIPKTASQKTLRPLLAMHNKARLGFDGKNTNQLRYAIIETCHNF